MKRRISRASAVLTVGVMLAQYGSAVAAPEPPDVPRPQEQLLEHPLNGEEAIGALGADLDKVAAINGLEVAELARDLRHDETMWIDPTGVAFYKEALPPEPPPAEGSEVAPGPFPNSQTFLLHSRPGAARVIYLDFDGQVVSGTAWNNSYGLSTVNQPAFDLDGLVGYSQLERDAIQSIFLRVAEDYAPFDVDVTTEDPGSAALLRSSSSDNEFGTRVLISNSWEASGLICRDGCGGVAYLTSFGRVSDNTYYQPNWVFPHMLAYDAKFIAEAASHEAGHALGLNHDGTSTLGYYQGHNGWAPIMGAGYYEPIVQWSTGEYSDANNTEDDFAVMQSWGAPLRTDDFGDLSAPYSLDSATSISGLIGTAADVDVFSITRACTTSTTFTADPASVSPNLDIRLRLLNPDQTQRAVDDPTSSYVGYDTAAGMGAAITQSLPAGTYLLEVSGVGRGTPTNGYSDYASVGPYSLAFNACSGDTTAPTLIGRSPAVNATGVAVGVNVTARFSEQVQGVDASTFVLRDTVTDAVVPAAVSLNASVANKWVLNPSANLVSGRTYAVVLTGGSSAIRDAAGNAFATASWSFTTAGSGDTTAPTLIGRSPAVNATGVAVGVNVTARFSEQVQGVDASTFVLRDTVTDAVVPAAVSLNASVANKWVLNPSANLVSGRTYAVVLTGGSSAIRDAAGNAFATASWSFTTAGSGDTTAPTLIGRSPAVNATGVAVGVNVTARFSEQVQGVDASTFVLRDTVTDAVVPAAVSLNASVANKWVLNPSANLVSGRTYAVVLTGGSSAIRDAAGNAFATRSWSFTTA